jgi:hypothetical protein
MTERMADKSVSSLLNSYQIKKVIDIETEYLVIRRDLKRFSAVINIQVLYIYNELGYL